MANELKILVADDHQVIIDGLEAIIAKQEGLAFIGGASDGHEVLRKAHESAFDIVLMDINMPNMDGLACTEALHKEYPDIKIIGLSMHDNPRLAKRMLKNGALGFLLKNSNKEIILEAIQSVASGKNFIDPSLLSSFFEIEESSSSSFAKKEMLTKRELEVIHEIYQEKTTSEIADSLHISPHTVESHRANILLKLDLKNTVALIKWAIKNEVV